MMRWRKQWRGAALGGAFVAMAVLPGQSCGPFFSDAVFVLHQPESREVLMRGQPWLIWPDFAYAELALAYRVLQGPAFTPAEIAEVSPRPEAAGATADQTSQDQAGPGQIRWVEARKLFTGQDGGPISTDATVPGQDWQSFGNCLDDAFMTAATTLEIRGRDYASAKPAVAEWVSGQDAVFSNCKGPGTLPAEAGSAMPDWLHRDRTYQLAAAHFYRAEWQAAQRGFTAIAGDSASAWHDLAGYMIARTLIRQAMLEKPDSIDKALLRQAEAQLRKVIREGGRYAGPARALENFVGMRIDPGSTAARVGDAIASPDAHLHQDLIDLRYAFSNPGIRDEYAAARRSELADWVLTAKAGIGSQEAAAHALERWRATKGLAWLTSAAMLAETPQPDLMAAIAAVPASSPAWATVTYHRLRLTQNQPGFEAEVTALLPKIEGVSTRNAFQELAQTRAGSLDDFLKVAAMEPAGYDNGIDGSITTALVVPGVAVDPKAPTMAGISVDAPGAQRFNERTAIVLNEQLPLETLAEIVQRKAFPKQLQFELAIAVWTRAVLLDKPEVARSLTPAMVEGEPGWKQWLAAYDSARTDDDRRAAALLALMRFPSVRPYVNAGAAREMGFVGYDSYRDNWWCAGMGRETNGRGGYSASYNYQGGPLPAAGTTLAGPPAPPFITVKMMGQASEESAALAKIGDAPEYFGKRSLAWVKAHPGDPRGADLLGFAFRAMRNGCNLEQSAGLRHEVFDSLHARYGESEWARKYATFGGDAN